MKRFTLTAASLLLGLTTAMAQDTKVTGHVVDENGDPVIGATILVKGTTLGTVTDFDGNFTLDVPAEHKHRTQTIGNFLRGYGNNAGSRCSYGECNTGI